MSLAHNITRGLRRFKPYPDYKDPGVEWLGEIPAQWEVRRLKYAARIEAGQSPPSELVTEGSDGLPFLQGNADFGPINPTPRQVCNQARKRARPADILLSVRAPVGAMNIADQAYGIGRGLCAIRPASSIDLHFCFHLLTITRIQLEAVATGSTYDAVTTPQVGDLPTLLPAPFEQRAIADFLDRETARIDALVAKKERLIELLQEKRTALITRAVTKGLDANVPMKDSSVEWLGKIPAHWEVRAVWTLFALGRGRVISHEEIHENPGPYPVYSSQTENDGVMGHIATHDFEGEYLTWTTDGAKAGTVFSRQGRFNCTNVCGTLRAGRNDQVDIGFVREALNIATTWFVRHDINPKLMNNVMARIRIQVPPPDEQRAIAAFLDRETARIDALIAKVSEAIDRLKELRTTLISGAVTGKIDVREEAS